MTPDLPLVPSGIVPLDERVGGLEHGGSYLVVGAPGPEKMVAALQFVHTGVVRGERCLLLTNSDAESILRVARAWGLEMEDAWTDGTLQIVGFKDEFELRAIRSIAPSEVLEELASIVPAELDRIAVDPGAMFLTGGAKTLLGSSYLTWVRNHPATALTTFSVDGGATSVPASADWLIQATTGRLLLERRRDGLYQVSLSRAIPEPDEAEEFISLELKPGQGLVDPENFFSRRAADRRGIEEDRLLLIALGDSHDSDLEAWATRAFDADVVTEPFEAVAKVQSGTKYGTVLIYAPRTKVREAVQACMAIRPLTRAAIVFASDDSVRSTDRIRILEAGADDSMSGVLDFRELRLRINQSVATGTKPVLVDASGTSQSRTAGLNPDEADRGRVPRGVFVEEVERRSTSPDLAFFCVLDVAVEGASPDELEEALADQVRVEEGDLVAVVGSGCVVLLQGARKQKLDAFLGRLRTDLKTWAGEKDGGDVRIAALGHPTDSDAIMTLLGASGAVSE